jgi:HEAT repeat protein
MIKQALDILLIAVMPAMLTAQVSMEDIILKESGQEIQTVRNRAIQVLKEIVKKSSSRYRDHINTSVRALGDFGSADAIPLLWERYDQTKSIEDKVLAIEAVGKLGDREEVGKLQEVFEGTDKFTTRQDLMQMPPSVAAGVALLTLKDRSGVVVMNAYLQGRDRQLQKRAAMAFGHTGEDSSIHLLIELLKEEDNLLKEAGIQSLLKVSKFGDPYVIASLKPLLDDSSKKIRVLAAKALGMLGDKSGKKILEEELEKNKYQPELLKILYDLGDEEKAAELVKLLPEGLRKKERKEAEDALIELRDESTIDPLIELLEASSTEAVISATRILAELKAEKAVPALLSCLKNEEQRIHEAAVNALGLIGSKSAIPPLRETMDELREADPFETRKITFRQNVAVALGNLGDETGIEHFFRKKKKRDKEYTEVDGINLAKIRHKAVVPEMVGVLRNPEIERTAGSFMAIVDSLQEFEAVEAVPILADMLRERSADDESDEMSREEVIAAIRFIGILGSADNVEELQPNLKDNEMRIRLEAAIAILRLLPDEGDSAYE